LTPRPPEVMVLNEPETSLHPDLPGPLARLVARASEKSQIIIVTHAPRLISALGEQSGCHAIMLEKKLGETGIVGTNLLTQPSWHWPSR
jgi:predicted ATPase